MTTLALTYDNFIKRISDVNKKDILLKLFKRILTSFLIFLSAAFIIISSEAIFQYSSYFRKIIFFGYISLFAATFIMFLIPAFISHSRLREWRRIRFYAGMVGRGIPEIKDTLLNALQLYDVSVKNSGYFSNELAMENFRDVDNKTKGFDFTGVIKFSSIKNLTIVFISSLVIFTSLFFIFPNVFQAAGYRLVNYNFNFIENKLGIAYDVKPGNIEITKGENVNISARISFNDPQYSADNILFFTRSVSNDGTELSSNSDKILPEKSNEFHASLNGVLSNTFYWFEYKGIKSEEYKISVTNRPLIKSSKIIVYPPAYTKLPVNNIDGNEISAIYGSKIYVELEASDDINKASVLFNDGSPYELNTNGKTASGSFTVSKNGVFKLNISKLFGDKELTNPNASDYQLHVIPDEYPAITIVEPAEQQAHLQNSKEMLIVSRITDDFGFTKIRLAFKLSKSKYGMTDKDYNFADIPIKNTDATGLEVPYVWNLSPLNLGTDDEVDYYVEVFDNDAVSGPKSTKSEIRKIVMPSLESLLNTEKSTEDIENSLKSAYDQAMDLKEQIEDIKEKVEKNPEELGLNDPKKQEELQKKIENIQNQFNSTQQKMNELMTDLQNNKQISKETLEKYMELQKMFQQIDSKELREMMKKLQDAMKNLDPDQMKDAMKNFNFDEENFKKALDKTMELLKKILDEQKFGDLTQKLDEITKKQDELKNKTQNTNENDKNSLNDLSKSQQELQKQYEDFMKELKQLVENMKQHQEEQTGKDLEKLMKEMQKKALEQKMNQSSQNLQNSQKNDAENKQSEISEDLNNFNRQMQDMLSDMMNNENDKLQQKMQSILDQLQKESGKQGELQQNSEQLDKDSPADEFNKNSGEQKSLQQDLSKSIEELMSLSQDVPNMIPPIAKDLGDAYNQMDKAGQQLQSKDAKSANKSQGDAKSSLDKAIQKMQSMCKNGKMPGKGSSLQQLLNALQQMIAKQQALNQQMGKLGQQGNSGKYSQEDLAQMKRLASEQQTLQKSLQQLNKEYKEQQEKEGTKMLGNLDEIQKDMMEVIKDLQDNNITPETRKRQERILSRMLDFQLSQREKDFEQKRESRPGKNYVRTSPPEVVISRPNVIDGINQDALELQKESYTEDYEMLIQKYLEKMRNMK